MNSSLPTHPFIEVSGVENFRDLGGYPIASQPGKILRRGLVFRSAYPSNVTESGVSVLQRLGIKHVYDLRSIQEIEALEQASHSQLAKQWEGAQRVFVPVFRDEDYSVEAEELRTRNYGNGPQGFVRVYMGILEAGSSPSNAYRPFAAILSQLASESPPTPILIHCSAGKDRTGVICALILSLCGVDADIVAQEYSLTEQGLEPVHDIILNNLMQAQVYKDHPEWAVHMLQAKKEAMLNTLGEIKSTYGSVENCVIKLGLLSHEGVARLRHHLIVDAA
ncbi:tyrosine phosphatase [Camillea tinctor]|nr:tyrosine phosphatase [Camillea tinctor]